MLKPRSRLQNWFLLFNLLVASFFSSLYSMEPLPDAQRDSTSSSKSFLPPPLESALRAIGTLVGDSGPTCFIARCYTGEDPRILEEQDYINCCLHFMGIRTILDVNGDRDGLPVGADTRSFMERGIFDSNFILYCLTPKGLERSRDPTSGFAMELAHVVKRLKQSYRNKRESDYLIPLLMAGDDVSSVPVELERRLFINAQDQRTGQFDFLVFLKEMWPLFGTRIFKSHPRLSEIQELLSKGAKELGSESSKRMVVPANPSLQPHVFARKPKHFNCSGMFFLKT